MVPGHIMLMRVESRGLRLSALLQKKDLKHQSRTCSKGQALAATIFLALWPMAPTSLAQKLSLHLYLGHHFVC